MATALPPPYLVAHFYPFLVPLSPSLSPPPSSCWPVSFAHTQLPPPL
ncbi:hypothetical protein AX774_g7400, partial [Zancudomyces culisetae]